MTDQPVADYSWTHSAAATASDRSAEDWLRATWEGGPVLLGLVLRIAWRFGLGLRLGPPHSGTHVLGWPITHNDAHSIVVATDSRLMRAQNTLTANGDALVWTTCVTYANPLGRLLWAPARVVHQWLVPRTLARAIRRNHGSTS